MKWLVKVGKMRAGRIRSGAKERIRNRVRNFHKRFTVQKL